MNLWLSVHTAIFKIDNQQGPAVEHMAAWMGGEFKGEWIHVYICMAESLSCPPETITALLIGHTPTQNKRFNFQKVSFWSV